MLDFTTPHARLQTAKRTAQEKGFPPVTGKSPCLANQDQTALRLLIFHFDDLLAIVIAALFAYPMSQLGLMALRAFHDAGDGKFPVRPARIAPRLRSFSLGDCPGYTSLSSFNSVLSAAKGEGGSSSAASCAQAHYAVFKSHPQTGHSPRQSGLHTL